MLGKFWLRAAAHTQLLTPLGRANTHHSRSGRGISAAMSHSIPFSPVKGPHAALLGAKPSPAGAAAAPGLHPATPRSPALRALHFSSSASGSHPDKPTAARSLASQRPTKAAAAPSTVVLDFPPGLERRSSSSSPSSLVPGLRIPAEYDTPLWSKDASQGDEPDLPPYVADGPGRLEVVMGPMFAGKSTTLISKVEAALAAGDPVTIVKSAKDMRYSSHWVVAHSGRCVRCHTAHSLMGWREAAPAAYASAKVLAIDEAQFFDDLVEFAVEACDRDGKVVLVAGLSGDFRRAPFGQMLQLVPLASSVTLLKARCFTCGEDAEFSLRVVASADQELVGGADKYSAACRRCYVQHHEQQEAAAQHPEALRLRAGPRGPLTPLVPPVGVHGHGQS